MSFKLPEYLKNQIQSCKWRKPASNFANLSNFYTGTSYYWVNYMQNVVRPCIDYANAIVDMDNNSTLSLSTGKAITEGAVKLVRGNKIFFDGNSMSCQFLSDIWSPQTDFNLFLNRAIKFMLDGGTSVIKINIDSKGRSKLSASRIDRTYFSFDECGNVTEAIFFMSLLSSTKSTNTQEETWLVEHRHYNDVMQPVIEYKAFYKAGMANAENIPDIFGRGMPLANLPKKVVKNLLRQGIKLNTEMLLPFRDGLGVWLMRRTGTNSVVPEASLGDPLLYGLLDLLWSMDVVFSGSLIDVLNGEGKILVPKQFLGDTMKKLKMQYPQADFNISTNDLDDSADDSLVYIKVEAFDKDKHAPTPVQFDIRADSYGKMLDIYAKEAAVRSGFSPTSLFPHLTPDSSAKSATEVTAEENMTRATVASIHEIILPVLNKALREVLYQEKLPTDVNLRLSDYIGNKIQYDANIRENYAKGLIPKEKAVQYINNLTVAETQEYMELLKQDGEQGFNDSDYFGVGNDNSEGQTELAGFGTGGSGEQNTQNSEGRLFESLTPPKSYGASGKNNPRVNNAVTD